MTPGVRALLFLPIDEKGKDLAEKTGGLQLQILSCSASKAVQRHKHNICATCPPGVQEFCSVSEAKRAEL